MKSTEKQLRYGDLDVPVLERTWSSTLHRLPYRKTYALKPGQHWKDAPTTSDQWEYYVRLAGNSNSTSAGSPMPITYPEDRAHNIDCIPAGAAIARELIAEGATEAVFTEMWGGIVLVGPDLVCVEKKGKIGDLLDQLKAANNNKWAGLPDVIAYFPDGRVALREAKHVAVKYRDRLGAKQHEFARSARSLLGDSLDLAVVEWGTPQESRNPDPAETFESQRAAEPVGAFPHAKRVGNLLFLSGIGPRVRGSNEIPGVTLDADRNILSYDIQKQCHAVFENVRLVLEDSGATWNDIVDVTVFLTNMKRDFAIFNRIYPEYFAGPGKPNPTRTTVEVGALPTPIAIELKVIAATS